MKKFLLSLFGVLVLTGGVGYLFREDLFEALKAQITKDMFVDADTDNFDAGSAIGATFPPIKALYQGKEVTSIENFSAHSSADKGMIFVANRSASW